MVGIVVKHLVRLSVIGYGIVAYLRGWRLCDGVSESKKRLKAKSVAKKIWNISRKRLSNVLLTRNRLLERAIL